ncbi:SDR family oxidoreductase [Lactiplantibacillus daowaiensis]|uniref:SDR family oxidoreductase n=1 Tax=Lactiplantibacillus daowaiensis TaxID=2559918 RepID=A0ABW1S1X5_9LACO|nr:SDR family oxidoreductase [Lactiplantibacillus daowaiensis]
MKYAVSAATGHFGQIVVRELLKTVAPTDIVAIVRNPQKAAQVLPTSIDVRQADYTDQAALTTALQGVDRLLMISSVPGGAISRQQQHQNVIAAAKAAGVTFIAYTSFAHAETAKSALSTDHVATEKWLRDSGLQVSFLRNAWYLENELSYLKAGATGQAAKYAAGDGKISFALEREYAVAAAKVLLTATPKPVYEFGGQPRTYADLAQAVAQATGRTDVEFQAVSDADYAADLTANGMSESLVPVFVGMQQMMRANELDVVSDDLPTVLGHELTPITTAINEILAR